MKKMTAVIAVVMVLSVAMLSATPASAAPQISSMKTPPAAAFGLLERVMQLFGFRVGGTTATVTGAPAPTTSTDEVIWGGSGRCLIPGSCR